MVGGVDISRSCPKAQGIGSSRFTEREHWRVGSLWPDLCYNSCNKSMRTIVSITLSVVFLTACNSFGKDALKANPFKEALSAAPALELPAKTADLVLRAKARDRSATTLNAVKGAVEINPGAATAIVGAVARAVPDMASVAAGAAAAEQPEQANAIARAAAAAAPSQAGKIVAAVCRAVPNDYRNVAAAVSQVVPGAGEEILRAVAAALPDLKAALDQALAGPAGNVASVTDVLNQVTGAAAHALAEASPLVRGPAVGPPFIPLTTTPSTVTPGTSGSAPTGGRNYARP